MNKMKLLLTLAIPVFIAQAAQAQTSRLTAQAHWTHDGAEFKRSDSTAYNYLSTARGGDLNNELRFDDATTWTYTMGDTQNNSMRYVQEFDGSNRVTTRVEQEWDMMLLTWANKWKYVYTYGTNGKKASMVTQHWDGTSAWITDSKNVYSYNAANQLYNDQFQLWDGISAYIPSSQTTYYYDGSGNIINETSVMFVSSTQVYTTQVAYTYNAANKVLTATHTMWSGASWDNTEMYTYTYDSSNRRTTNLHQTWDGTTFVNDLLHLYSNFAGMNPMTDIEQTWDATGTGSWVDRYKYANTYNSATQLTSSTRQSNDLSIGWTYTFGDTKANYYYGAYVSVKNVSHTGGNANLFPVPAQDILNVEMSWNQAQPATITLVDMQGRVVKTVAVAAGTKAQAAVSVAGLADGMYMVNINGTNGQIVKQIVVAH